MPVETQGQTIESFTQDGKSLTQESSRPLNTNTVFTSEGDDISNITNIWGGETLEIVHASGDSVNEEKTINWNIKENDTYIHEGYMMWDGCQGDRVTLKIVSAITDYVNASGTNYLLYGGYLVLPAVGNGNIEPSGQIKLVEIPIVPDTGLRAGPGYWDADYNLTGHYFENITPNPTGSGAYNIYTQQVTMRNFVYRIKLRGSGFIMLQSADSSHLGQGMDMKLCSETVGDDHDWSISCVLTIHREKTS